MTTAIVERKWTSKRRYQCKKSELRRLTVDFANKSEAVLSPELRPLAAAEINSVAGGVIWVPPTVVAIAVATFLFNQRRAAS